MSVKDAFGGAWNFVAAADRLLTLEKTTNEAIAGIRSELTAMDRRLTDVEHRIDRLADDCKAAARAGTQEAMMGHIAETSRRLAVLETLADKPKRVTKRRPPG